MVRTYLALVVVVIALASCIESNPERVSDVSSSPETTATDTAVAADVSGEPCDQSGDQRCTEGREGIEVCGDDGFWQRTGCGANRVCIDYNGAHCLETTGEQGCRDLLYCFLGCSALEGEEAQTQCGEACFVTGTAMAQEQLDDAQTCMVAAGCVGKELQESLECIGDTCGTDLAFCYFPTHAEKGCAQIVACQDACGDDTDCGRACGTKGSIRAQAEYAVLELCLFFTCASQPDNVGCVEEAADVNGNCRSFAVQCINPIANRRRR